MNQKQAIRDAFWSPFRETVRREGIPYQWLALNDRVPGAEPSHWMRNFRAAASGKPGAHGGCVFQDSDGAKWLEGVAYSLRSHPDPALEAIADGAIEAIVAAQQPDGYLDTYYILTGLDRRWTNLRDNHELYCAGHMIEAAVAYYESTGKRALLDAMLRYVDLIDREIGPRRGQRHGYPGHPEIELALMRLYRLTGDEKHLRLAKYFIDERGQKPLYFEQETRESGNDFPWKDSPFGYQYYQAGKPVREQTDAEGHAVRAMYLYCGMADVARATGDESLVRACEALWESTVRRRMYVTGAIGSSAYGESFTFDYDLPNDTVYGETCAAIGLVFFARRMLALRPRGEYADVMERALYNGVLSGMQLDGKRFFYVNPLEVNPVACAKDPNKRHVKPERQKWFGCACCPPNLIRLLMSLEDYVCSADGNALHVHLYIGGDFTARVGSSDVRLHVETRYPWDGDICLNVELERPASFALALRIPEWCRKWQIGLNDRPGADEIAFAMVFSLQGPGGFVGVDGKTQVRDGYAYIEREWKPGDRVRIMLDMPAQFVRANPRVAEDAGKVALTRGPLVYCLEEADNGPNLHLVRAGSAQPHVRERWQPQLLGGVTVLETVGLRESDEWTGPLYAPARGAPETQTVQLRWIPYYAWANRGTGEMRVWVRE